LRPANSVDTGIEKKLKQFHLHMVSSGSAIFEHLTLYDKVKGFSLAAADGTGRDLKIQKSLCTLLIKTVMMRSGEF
jgi:hypothetical protein